MMARVLDWPRPAKRLVVVAADVVFALMAMWLAFTLRLDHLHRPIGAQWAVYALGPLLAMPVFMKFGLYRAIFRYTGLAAMTATAVATMLYGTLLFVALTVLQRMGFPVIPRSIGILQPLIFLLLVGGSRAAARFWLAGLARPRGLAEGRLLIYGAGSAGAQTAAALQNSTQFILLGFVDDDVGKIGRSINGLPVHGPGEVAKLVERNGITDILLALPSISRARRNEIIESLQPLPVHVRTLPGMADLARGRVTLQDFRELDIEDLLGREPVPPDPALLARSLAGKTVMVTGAAGSIGSELCRQIVLQRPSCLLLFDHSEFGLYTVHQELLTLVNQAGIRVTVEPLLGSVRHADRVREVMQRYRPDTVYHAAAYKHVPMVEINVAEGVQNNVFGTLFVATTALETGVERFILISTDKAVRPTNVMGTTKRLAEMVLQALAAEPSYAGKPFNTCFSMVRFGNVLGSSGSVVPLFRRQLLAGGPLTVTHPEVTRYFMTIPEAAQLVIQAGAMASGGEVFVLDMGEPVKIIDLAHRMATLSGLTVRDGSHPEGDIDIVISGLRPGEKLYEELLIGDNPRPTPHPQIMQAKEGLLAWPALSAHLEALQVAATQNGEILIRRQLEQLVPEARL